MRYLIVLLFGLALPQSQPVFGQWTEKVILSFGGKFGTQPTANVIEGADHALYGTTTGGSSGMGNVFKLNKDGTGFLALHTFKGNGDGIKPVGGLVQGDDGALYGTTSADTRTNSFGTCCGGLGVIFKVNPDSSGFLVLHDFGPGNVSSINSALVRGTDGALYGTTENGGPSLGGTVYKINQDGSGFAVLHGFSPLEADSPIAGVVQGKDGKLYGTANTGKGKFSPGTVFTVDIDGSNYQTIYPFNNDSSTNGLLPGPLIQATDGALYGLCTGGGTSFNGTIFTLHTDGTGFNVLYRFKDGDDGSAPAGLIQGKDGLLYGVTKAGNNFATGTIFQLHTDGTGYNILYKFKSSADAQQPFAGLVQASDGAFYGTTFNGGDDDSGALFKLSQKTTPVTLSLSGRAGPIRLSGPANINIVIESSSDLANWAPLATNILSGTGNFDLTDTAAAQSKQKFYRGKIP